LIYSSRTVHKVSPTPILPSLRKRTTSFHSILMPPYH
jgi:hypothetical protein